MKHKSNVTQGNTQEIITLHEAAELLRLSDMTIYRMARKGELPGKKIGKHWRFRKDILLNWVGGWEERFDKLLEESMVWAKQQGVTPESVQKAIKETRAKTNAKSRNRH